MNCNTTHYRANSSSVPGDPTAAKRNPGDKIARGGVELAEGLKALAGGDKMEAAQRFEIVLDLDPSNAWAARELAKMRRQATNDRRGALSRLLTKMS